MKELHAQSADVARSFLASQFQVIDERSRLFTDLKELALEKLMMLRKEKRSDRVKPSGELRAYWPAMRPAA
jgi:hypothetical protein